MTLNEYKLICFRHWMLHGVLPAQHLDETALWTEHHSSDNTPLHAIKHWQCAEFSSLWNERVLIPGLHTYVNTPDQHIGLFFRHYKEFKW